MAQGFKSSLFKKNNTKQSADCQWHDVKTQDQHVRHATTYSFQLEDKQITGWNIDGNGFLASL